MSQQQQQQREWEQVAIRELVEISHWLVTGSFETKQDLLDRLRLSTRAIALTTAEEASHQDD